MLITIISTAAAAVIITAVLGFALIPWLRKLKFGQTILDIGPAWHKKSKQGTPTMGGMMFVVGTTAAITIGMILLAVNGLLGTDELALKDMAGVISVFAAAFFFGFIGFIDDFIKVKKKQNEGLTAMQKIIMQVLVIAAFFTARVISGDTSTVIKFPFIGELDLWYFYYIIMGLGILYIVNAVNLTDGIDGLCSSVTFVYMIAFAVISAMLGFAGYTIIAVATAGGCLGFLIWNWKPAKVFMGDTGSMYLGGMVAMLGIALHVEVLMVIAAAVYIWEALTVLIQMTYFKITHGKRLFKMTPIHHSFELRGWKEQKIVIVFSAIGAVAGTAAVLLVNGI
ncbi:MAG TPA: phospho-N-acetylmuramoyl-pentapeptide-transferase [Ruminococcaceae bacterium]|nr:phospho-N-acetylmuramoyl-pentapeptide-transferase [Oscillospiraceae bacterium]